ncbi:MAG: MBL fold metallo-hydrolase [Theionarchaea archaeon]|nr:MBL fold metallo-hydrolase [Theionarchaea archaeon]
MRPRLYKVNESWRNPEGLRAPAFKMIDPIYYVGNLDVSCHLIETVEGLVLIDTTFANTAHLVLDSIGSLGFDATDIVRILITHGHEDHAGGVRRILEATGASVSIHERDVDTVEKGTELTCGYYVYGVEEFETFVVNEPLVGGEVLEFGNVAIKVHHTPGHTPGCCSYEIPIEHEGERLTAFLFGGPGQWTFRPEDRVQGYPGDMDEYRRTLEFLGSIEVDVPLGAHPGQTRTMEKMAMAQSNPGGPNPFIDPGHWPTFIGSLRERYMALEQA